MAIKRTVKREAMTDGAPTDRGGIGSPSLRTRILQPRFKCVAHCNNKVREEGHAYELYMCARPLPFISLQSLWVVGQCDSTRKMVADV